MNTVLQGLLAYVVRAIAGLSADDWRWLLSAITTAASTFSASDDKRGWVMTQIKIKFPNIAKSLAAFLIESGLQYLKAKGAQT